MCYPLDIGCTVDRHERIGIDAVVNARGGVKHLNDETPEEIEMWRDAGRIRRRIEQRVRFYQFNSKFFRRHQQRFQHLISSHDD